jgi:hypothetical protein
MFCPNCSSRLTSAEASSCLKCGALFGAGSEWLPVANPGAEGELEPVGFARSGFALLLFLLTVIFLGLALQLKGTAVGAAPPLVLGVVCGVSGGVVIVAKSRTVRTGATVVGAVILVVLVWAFVTVASKFPP